MDHQRKSLTLFLKRSLKHGSQTDLEIIEFGESEHFPTIISANYNAKLSFKNVLADNRL